jgi:DNA-binding response OmpR family regulator
MPSPSGDASRSPAAFDEIFPVMPDVSRAPSRARPTPVRVAALGTDARGGHVTALPLLVATADATVERLLTFALDQVRLPHRIYRTGTHLLDDLLAMPAHEAIPVIVLDLDLPGVDGHALLEQLTLHRPDGFLVLALSSHADESMQVRSLLLGAVEHLAKPFNIRVLVAKLERWMRFAARHMLRDAARPVG